MDIREIYDLAILSPFVNTPINYNKPETIGTSDCNPYIPTYALEKHVLYMVQNGEDLNIPIIEYSELITVNPLPTVRNYRDFILGLVKNPNPKEYIFKIGEVSHKLVFQRGLLRDMEGNILMCLCVESDYALRNSLESIRITPNKDKFILYITDTLREEKYKNIKKKLETEYIDKVRALKIDIIETANLKSKIYSNNFKPIKFKNIVEMKKHLKEEVPKNLLELLEK